MRENEAALTQAGDVPRPTAKYVPPDSICAAPPSGALLRKCGPASAGERKDGNAEERRKAWPESLECALGHGQQRRFALECALGQGWTRPRHDDGGRARAWDPTRSERRWQRQQL